MGSDMDQRTPTETFPVVTRVPVNVRGSSWQWYLSHKSLLARLSIPALWMGAMIIGLPAVIIMGSATVFLALLLWLGLISSRSWLLFRARPHKIT